MPSFQRRQVGLLVDRLAAEPHRVLAVVGPRQTGKTVILRQALDRCGLPFRLVAVDEPDPAVEDARRGRRPTTARAFPPVRDARWLVRIWEWARLRAARFPDRFVLAFDGIQRIPGWSEVVEGLRDRDRAERSPLRAVVSGSSPLTMQEDTGESLTGRFEEISTAPWAFPEMEAAFGFGLEQFVFYGGYPGGVKFIGDFDRWRAYITRAVAATAVERDLLGRIRVNLPALLTLVFRIACGFSGQIVSYQKMIGELRHRGNPATLARYLDLLERVGLVAAVSRYTGPMSLAPSSPKLQVLDTSLMAIHTGHRFEDALADRTFWGRLVESAVGAHLLNTRAIGERVYYWRDGEDEVDFVVERGPFLAAIEVKTGRSGHRHRGLLAFSKRYPRARAVLVGPGETPLSDFLSVPAGYWVSPE